MTIFNIFIPTILHCVLQKLDEVESVEIIKGKIIIEVIILRQENEGKFWCIIYCLFLTAVTGIKLESTQDLSDRDVSVSFNNTITKM